MPKTPSKMHMYDMVKIDTIVFDSPDRIGLRWIQKKFTIPPPKKNNHPNLHDLKKIHKTCDIKLENISKHFKNLFEKLRKKSKNLN